jgi:hypothetical protein
VLIDCILSFLEYYEENGLDILVYMKNMWHSKIQSREDFQLSFLMMIYFYYDILKFEFGIQNYFFCDKIELIEKIGNMNSIEAIIHKIDVLCYGHEMVRCNLNVNLLMDDIVIRLGEFNECS